LGGPPLPRGGGFAARSRSWREVRFAAPAGAVWRRRSAALGFRRRPGSPPATESGVARPASVPLRSFLPPWIFRSVLRGGSVVSRPSPPLRSGWGNAPALTPAPPQWRRCERREQRKNCRGPAAHAAERSRSATRNSRSQGWGRRTAPCCLSAVGFRPAPPTPDRRLSAHPAFQPPMLFIPASVRDVPPGGTLCRAPVPAPVGPYQRPLWLAWSFWLTDGFCGGCGWPSLHHSLHIVPRFWRGLTVLLLCFCLVASPVG
jgi:hypothetical protein